MSNILKANNYVKPKIAGSKPPKDPKDGYWGMELIGVEWINIADLDAENKKNPAREKPSPQEKICDIAACIRAGEYRPFHFEPPLVEWNEETKKYTIITGRTRYSGHRKANEPQMWCAIVKFDSNSARLAAAARENLLKDKNGDFGQTFSTDADIANTLKQLLLIHEEENPLYEPTWDYMEELLRTELCITDKVRRDPILKEVAASRGVVSRVDNWTNEELEKVIIEEFAKHDIDITAVASLVQTLYRSSTRAQHERSFKKMMNAKQEHGVERPVLEVKTFAGNETECKEKRAKQFKKFGEQLQQQLDYAGMISNKRFTKPLSIEAPQIEGDMTIAEQVNEIVKNNVGLFN